jgi:hypothetical protein
MWRVYVDYGSGYGWVPVSWAPTFKSKTEAEEWAYDDSHDWESPVSVQFDEVN